MRRPPLIEISAFLTVARKRSFTRAAAQLGVSPSALSQSIRTLEEKLGVRLLTRTTRSVAPTEAGERLMSTVGPHMDQIESELSSLSNMSSEPTGTIRISTVDHAAETVLWPALSDFLATYPGVQVDITVDNVLMDIVAEKYDAGIRMGERVARDMIAVKIGPELCMAAVATPTYFAENGEPKAPQDLASHNCINLRLSTLGGVYAWEFEQGSREVNVRVEGQLATNDIAVIKKAVLAGSGIGFMPEDIVRDEIKSGELKRVLADWNAPFPGYHLYYPNRRQHTPAFSAFVDALRYRG